MKTREATFVNGTTTVAAAKALGSALWTLPERIAEVLYQWQKRASDRHHLRRLDDRMLKDLYQRQLLLTFVRPISQSDGHDRLWLIDELVPSFATGLDDGVIIFEDAVGEPILAQVLPDILDRVQLG